MRGNSLEVINAGVLNDSIFWFEMKLSQNTKHHMENMWNTSLLLNQPTNIVFLHCTLAELLKRYDVSFHSVTWWLYLLAWLYLGFTHFMVTQQKCSYWYSRYGRTGPMISSWSSVSLYLSLSLGMPQYQWDLTKSIICILNPFLLFMYCWFLLKKHTSSQMHTNSSLHEIWA